MLTAIQETIDLLPAIRQDSRQWNQYDYRPVQTEHGINDGHARQRLKLLVALQYHWIDADEALIRHLLEQEIVSRQEDSYQGYDESLELSAFLLAQFKRRSDIWLFAEAKRANFDTLCGFSAGFFLFCGPQVALDEITQSQHESKSFVLEYVLNEDSTPRYAQTDVDEEWNRLLARFPRDPTSEPPMVWIDRAVALDEIQQGRDLLDDYEHRNPDTRKDNSYTWELLGDVARAIESKQLVLDDADSSWDRVFCSTSLAKLYLKNQQPTEAWQMISGCAALLPDIDGWHEVGLGRSLVETAFEIVTARGAPNLERPAVYQWALERFKELAGAHLVLLQKANAAAREMNDQRQAKKFQRLADQEQREIDEMLGN